MVFADQKNCISLVSEEEKERKKKKRAVGSY